MATDEDVPKMEFDIAVQMNLHAARDERQVFDTNRSVGSMRSELEMPNVNESEDNDPDDVTMASSTSDEVPSMVDTDSSQQEPSTISQDSASQVARRMNADSAFRQQVLATTNTTAQSPPNEDGADL